MNAKKLQEKAQKLFAGQQVNVYKGHSMSGDYGWIMRPFGKNEIFLGANLKDAHAEIDNKISYKAELS
jgi:hypothetical protein